MENKKRKKGLNEQGGDNKKVWDGIRKQKNEVNRKKEDDGEKGVKEKGLREQIGAMNGEEGIDRESGGRNK